MGLQNYRNKRDFNHTPEPPAKKQSKEQVELQFVVQEHHASHLHFDFRLEVEGVLKSWAVPKGPPQNASEKRLAIQVEDHPFDYLTFEGTIPKGSYGAGTVKIWDIGYYTAEEAKSVEESQRLMRKGLEEGHVKVLLHGKKMQGPYSLIRFKGEDSNQWLFIKKT